SSRLRKRPGCAIGGMVLSSVIVDDFNVVSIAVAKFEADAPAPVHGRRPRVSAIALELVKAHAPQRAEVLQRCRHIECKQQIDSGIEMEARKLVGLLAHPTSRVTSRPPDRPARSAPCISRSTRA